MTAELSPFDVLSRFRVSREHLLDAHSLNPVWIPREETFEAFLDRVNEIHAQAHEAASALAPVSHEHRPAFVGNGCPECGGFGWVVAYGARRPARLPCPECAGLAITPASADELTA